MKVRMFFVVCLAMLLSGCATYIVTLKDGKSYETSKQPELDTKTGFYKIETKDGDKLQINKSQIVTIKEK